MLSGIRPADVKDDVKAQLRGIDAELKRLLKKDSLCACDCGECLAGNCADYLDQAICEGSQAAKEILAELKAFAAELSRVTM